MAQNRIPRALPGERRWAPTFFANETFGINLNQDARFSGTPEEIYDGESVWWAANNVVGVNLTAPSNEQAFEGVNSAKWTNPAQLDSFEFRRASDISVSSFVAVSMQVYVTSGYSVGDSIQLTARDAAGTLVGTGVLLESYFSQLEFNVWHEVAVPLAALGLTTETIRSFRFELVLKAGAGPTIFFDKAQLQEQGAPLAFRVVAGEREELSISELVIVISNDVTTAIADGTLPGLDPLTVLGESFATGGLIIQQVVNGVTLITGQVTNFCDGYLFGMRLEGIGNLTDACVRVGFNLPAPLVVSGPPALNYLQAVILEDFSGFTRYHLLANGAVAPR